MKLEDVPLSTEPRPEIEHPKGYINLRATAWCGGCYSWLDLGTGKLSTAVKMAVAQGWKKTKKRGWLCHTCQNA